MFGNYLKPGDSLGIEIDLTQKQLVSIKVSTYLGKPPTPATKNPVTLTVKFASLASGIRYAEESVLEAPSKQLKVDITNSGYRPR